MNNENKVSVIMGVYNCAETLSESIDSIIEQTYTNWELIMCDDASTDKSLQIMREYEKKYSNIYVLKNEKNMGLNYTLNKCLEVANGQFIARMDGDDISLKNRFEEEIKVLLEKPNISIVSCPMIYFDSKGEWGRGTMIEYPQKEDFIKGTPFCHAPCMVRREAYMAVQGYSVEERLLRVEDYHLWMKMYAEGYKGYNIQRSLYKMRDDRNATARRKFKYRLNEAYVRGMAIKKLGLSKKYYISILRPILVGILPTPVYEYLHKRKQNNKL